MTTPNRNPIPSVAYSPGDLRYGLGLLTIVYVINFVDRQILAIRLQSIKTDLQLRDGQLGLLSGRLRRAC